VKEECGYQNRPCKKCPTQIKHLLPLFGTTEGEIFPIYLYIQLIDKIMTYIRDI
jgi:hypothetical protein